MPRLRRQVRDMSLYITGHSLVRRSFTPRVIAEFSKVIDDAYSRLKVAGQGGLTMPRLRRQVRDMSLYITGHSLVRRSFTPRVVAEFSKVIDDAYSRVKVAGQGEPDHATAKTSGARHVSLHYWPFVGSTKVYS